MKIDNAVAIVTGANPGIGLAFTLELLSRGARKVYAGARDPSTVEQQPGVQPIRLDVTKPDDVAGPASPPPGRSPIRCAMSWPRKRRRSWLCTWRLSIPI